VKQMRRWQLQEAKNKFSQVAEEAATYGAQVVTKHGRDAFVLLSISDYERLRKPKTNLVQFLKDSPLPGSRIDVTRDQDAGREPKL